MQRIVFECTATNSATVTNSATNSSHNAEKIFLKAARNIHSYAFVERDVRLARKGAIDDVDSGTVCQCKELYLSALSPIPHPNSHQFPNSVLQFRVVTNSVSQTLEGELVYSEGACL